MSDTERHIYEDGTAEPAHYQTFTMRDFDRNGLLLLDLTYLEDEFDIHSENEKGKPVRVTLTQKTPHPPPS